MIGIIEVSTEETAMDTTINISPLGVHMLAIRMLLDQLDQCQLAVAHDCETVTLLDGKEHDAVPMLRETAGSIAKAADELADIVEMATAH
jgi:hypothetical protein